MPAYEYEVDGRVTVRVVPVAERDRYPGRRMVPSRIFVCPRGQPEHGSELLRGWKECEESGGTESTRQMARSLGLSRSQVREFCEAPDAAMERPVGPGSEIV